jgi:hypothetical protein
MHNEFSLHHFEDIYNMGFDPVDYSHLKFGCDKTAMRFGYELADGFFKKFHDVLLANRCVVIPSPYNFVPNAATIMTKHFVDRLNSLLVNENGVHVDYSIIHRKVSYINDYGFLSKEKRASLINGDDFFLNTEYLEGKLLIFVDDVKITGTHEEKLIDIMQKRGITNDCFFLYFASYCGDNPTIEAQLNFAGIHSVLEYADYILYNESHIIVRPLKYLLSQEPSCLRQALKMLPAKTIREIYCGCLGEGYYKLPSYQGTFKVINEVYNGNKVAVES